MTASAGPITVSTGTRTQVVIETMTVVLVVGLVAAGQTRPAIGAGMVAYALLALASPLLALGLLVAFLVFVSASQYGLLSAAGPSDWDLYWLGVNQLNVSAAELFLGILLLATVMRRASASLNARAEGFPVAPTVAFAAVYAFEVALAVWRGNSIGAAVNFYSGRLVFDALLVAVLVAWIVDNEQRDRATRFFVALITIRALYGLIRYALFGGDPLNYYANYQHINVTISFWEAADSAFLAFGALYSLGKVARSNRATPLDMPGWLVVAALASADIALTHRRSTVLGFILAVLSFFALEGLWKRPSWLLLPGAAAAAGLYGLFQRFHSTSLIDVLTVDILNPSGTISGGRALESASALATVLHHPLLGAGPAGAYQPLAGFNPFAPTTLVHSAILHLWLKLGLPGLLAGAWLLGDVLWRPWKVRRAEPRLPADRLLVNAALGSFVIWLVDMVIGTPLIEQRTMLVIGLWVGIILVGTRTSARLLSDVAPS